MKKIVLLISMLSVIFGAELIEMSQDEIAALGVQTQRVKSAPALQIGSFNAKLSLGKNDEIVIDAKFEGVVEKIYVQNYAVVKKNQPLLRIKSAALLMLQKEYVEQNLALKTAKKNYKRDKKLEQRGVISQKRLLQSKMSYKKELAAFETLQERLRLSGFTHAEIEHIAKSAEVSGSIDIVAPKSGEILELGVMRGEFVQPSTPLLHLYAEGEFFLDISLPVERSDEVSLEDIALFEGMEARVVSISNIVDASSQSLIVRAKLPSERNNKKRYQLGRIYDVVLQKSQTQGVRVEKSSLVYKEAKPLVFKRHERGFVAVDVEILSEQHVYYIVGAPLQEGDELALSATAALLSAMEAEDE